TPGPTGGTPDDDAECYTLTAGILAISLSGASVRRRLPDDERRRDRRARRRHQSERTPETDPLAPDSGVQEGRRNRRTQSARGPCAFGDRVSPRSVQGQSTASRSLRVRGGDRI